MFSSRLPHLAPNAQARALSRARLSGKTLFDLTESNPTAVGFSYPTPLLRALSSAEALQYRPEPRGMDGARQAVAAEHAGAGVTVDPGRIVLSSGTSEAYSTIFKLLCDPGNEVLVPVPSYPLFDLLTRLDGVAPVPYRLDRSGRWCLDRVSIEGRVTAATRAILVVSPNNPTGSIVTSDDRDWLAEFCGERGIAIIADEVFGEYRFRAESGLVTLAGESRCLTFTLGGLSKSVGLPQLKLAWTMVSGPDDLVSEALERIDVISDTYLSVSTPVQAAASDLLSQGRGLREQIRGRLVRNLDALRVAVAARPEVTLHEPDGGWSVVLRVPAVDSEEAIVLRLIEEAEVVVQPGYFFDFDEEAFLIVSLLPSPEVFDEGIGRLLGSLAGGR